VCMCVCVYIYMYTCVCVCVCVCIIYYLFLFVKSPVEGTIFVNGNRLEMETGLIGSELSAKLGNQCIIARFASSLALNQTSDRRAC
jgi:hypothetical protein